ncbi:hypothetical protein MTO96_021447 [Rhipicephalus appendiculatus]
MKLNRGKQAYVRVTEISLAIFFALNAPVAVARVIPASCGNYDFGRVCRDVYRCPIQDQVRCRQPQTTCQPVKSGIDDADKEIILAAHNRYRSRTATGNYSKLPYASNMLEMLAWATTWKVGCGYTTYSSRSAFDSVDKHYTCAYGPGGNVRGEEIYKVGPACTHCPEGTCCGESCEAYNIAPSYNGLCKVIDDDGPAFPLDDKEHLLLGCLFNKATSRSCDFRSDPEDGWETKTFFGRGYAESVLESGQSAEMTFEQPVQSRNGRLCVKVEYNKGPNVTGTTDRGMLELVVTPVDQPQRQRIFNLSGRAVNIMSITLNYNIGVKIGFSFIVPRGSPAQFVNIHKVLVYEKACYESYG